MFKKNKPEINPKMLNVSGIVIYDRVKIYYRCVSMVFYTSSFVQNVLEWLKSILPGAEKTICWCQNPLIDCIRMGIDYFTFLWIRIISYWILSFGFAHCQSCVYSKKSEIDVLKMPILMAFTSATDEYIHPFFL